jgi:hypothetical protein
MSGPIRPETFWTAFVRELSDELAADQDWQRRYDSEKVWTNFMMSVLEKTGKVLEFREAATISREYLRLDMAFFSYPLRPATDILWNPEVAIEHENHSWFDEWIKLSHAARGLKVLVTYHDHRPNRPTLDEKLRRAHELYVQPTGHCLLPTAYRLLAVNPRALPAGRAGGAP